MDSKLTPVLSRQEYTTDIKPKINWDYPEEKRLLLESYVVDALNLVAAVRASQSLLRDLKHTADLLERMARQDTDDGDGQIRMKRDVAKDRIIFVTDPDMHHGHKTSSFKLDRYKSHIMTDATFVTSMIMTPANKADTEPFSDVIDHCEEDGVKFKKVIDVSAHCN